MLTDKLGRPLRDLRISLTDRCNYRCQYCMPAERAPYDFLPQEALLTATEIARLAGILMTHGVRKIRLTGGEPLLRKDIEQIVSLLAVQDGLEDLAITTNGVLLPDKADALVRAGLRRVNVSLDSLDNTVYRRINGGRGDLSAVLTGLAAADAAGLSPLKINAVIRRGVNENAVLDLARFCRARGYTLRFIEYMDAGNSNGWSLAEVVTSEEILAVIHGWQPLVPVAGEADAVATRYRYQDGSGEVGVITAVTQPFCRTCTRLRLSADGKLYTCLFASTGVNLRDLLRGGASDNALSEIIALVWQSRADRYSEHRLAGGDSPETKVEMHHIGG